MIRKYFLLGFVLVSNSLTLWGQSIDSLKGLLMQHPPGLEKHKIAIQIVEYFDDLQGPTDSIIKYTSGFEEFVNSNRNHRLTLITKYHILSSHYKEDSLVFFNEGRQLIEEAKRAQRYDIVGRTTVLMGGKYRVMSGFDQGISTLEDGLKIIEAQQDSLSQYYQARTYSLLSSLNSSKGNLHKALEYGLTVQTLAQQISNENLLLRSYFNIGTIYGNLSSDEKKLAPKADRERYKKLNIQYQQLAYDFCKDKKISRSKGIATFNLGLYYSNNKKFEKSNSLLKEAITIGEDLPWYELLFNVYDVLSANLSESGNQDSSFIYMQKAKNLAREMNSPYHILSSEINYGNYFMLENDFVKARKHSLVALDMSKERNLYAKELTIYDLLHEIEQKAGNHKSALDYYKKNKQLKDSISGEKHLNQINELIAKYDHAQQNAQIEKLKKDSILQKQKIERKNGIILISILTGLFISCLIYFLHREKSLKAEKRELAAQQKLLRSQLNPHFLFNALNSIQQYIYLQKEPKLVADYLAKFSRLTRRILHNSNQDLIELREEVDFLRDYMDLQKLRFDVPFEYSIHVDEELFDEEIKIPPMFTQPFIENSIEHGILNKKEKGKIDIHIAKNDDQIQIELTDNGIGIDKSIFKKKNHEHRSMAINLTKDRLKAFDKKLRTKTDLIIKDLAGMDETITGTQVTLKLPILY